MAIVFSSLISATGDDGQNTAPATAIADTWKNDSLRVGLLNASFDKTAIGLRFNNVTIPQGATIIDASLTLTPKETDADLQTAKIYGVDIDDAAAWGDTNLPQDSGTAPDNTATRTTAKVDWTIPAISYTPYSQYTTYEDVPNYTSTSQTKGPGTTTDSSVVGTFGWNTPNNAQTENGQSAHCNDGSNNATSHALKCSNFGFNVPSGAVINGVSVRIRKQQETSGTNANDSTIKLLKGLSLSGSNKATATEWSTSYTNTYYGASNDLWGNSLTVNDVNSSGFGVGISVFIGNSNENAYIDYVEITVSYTYISSYTSTPTVHTINEAVSPISTPDIAPVVKEIIDRAGWTSGSDMAFAIVPDTGTTNWTKEFFDYIDSTAYVASLRITHVGASFSTLSSMVFSEDEKAHICIAGNTYALGRYSPSYPLALAGTMTQALTTVEQVAQMGVLTFVAGSDDATHPIFAKTATTYINVFGQLTIETPVVEGEFEGIKIHFGTDISLSSSTLANWIQVYTKYDNESAWSASSIELVAEYSEQYIEASVTTNKNLQVKIVIDPVDSSTPNKISNIEIY